MATQLQNPFQTITQLVQNNQISQLFSYLILLAQKYKVYISASFEVVTVSTETSKQNNQQILVINAYLPDYIIQYIIDQQNNVKISVTPAIQVNCGGNK